MKGTYVLGPKCDEGHRTAPLAAASRRVDAATPPAGSSHGLGEGAGTMNISRLPPPSSPRRSRRACEFGRDPPNAAANSHLSPKLHVEIDAFDHCFDGSNHRVEIFLLWHLNTEPIAAEGRRSNVQHTRTSPLLEELNPRLTGSRLAQGEGREQLLPLGLNANPAHGDRWPGSVGYRRSQFGGWLECPYCAARALWWFDIQRSGPMRNARSWPFPTVILASSDEASDAAESS